MKKLKKRYLLEKVKGGRCIMFLGKRLGKRLDLDKLMNLEGRKKAKFVGSTKIGYYRFCQVINDTVNQENNKK